MVPDDSIGARIRRARGYRDMKQKELAQAIGLSPNALNAIERGHTKDPGSSIIQAIARELKVRADYLLCLSEEIESELEPAVVA